jgi:hypothetical protein
LWLFSGENEQTFSHNFSWLICHVSCTPKPRKRRFLQQCEKLCEKNGAAAQADSANQTKSYVRKISAFSCSLDGNEAAKTLQHDLEKLCERTARQLYGVSEPRHSTAQQCRKKLCERKPKSILRNVTPVAWLFVSRPAPPHAHLAY